MADSDMVLAYIGKMLGQLGSALGGNQQNLVNFGQQAAATNENTLADIQRKKAKEEEEKKQKNGILGDILNIGGDVASVAFPELAPVIQPVTKVAAGGVTGGTEGALMAAAPSALSLGASQLTKSAAPEVASKAAAPSPAAPAYDPATQGVNVAKMPTNPLVSSEANPEVPQISGKTVSAGTENFKAGVGNLLADPSFQSHVSSLISKYNQPEDFTPNTIGMSPDTGFALNKEFADKAARKQEINLRAQDRQDRLTQNATENQFAKERLDISKQSLAAKGPSVKTLGSKPMKQEDGTYAYPALVDGVLQNLPVPGVPVEAQHNTQMTTIGGVPLPVETLIKAHQGDEQAVNDYVDYVNMALPVMQKTAPFRQVPPQPTFIPGPQQGTGALINRNDPSAATPLDIRTPEQKTADEVAQQIKIDTSKRAEKDQVMQEGQVLESKVVKAVTMALPDMNDKEALTKAIAKGTENPLVDAATIKQNYDSFRQSAIPEISAEMNKIKAQAAASSDPTIRAVTPTDVKISNIKFDGIAGTYSYDITILDQNGAAMRPITKQGVVFNAPQPTR